jgi:hypothetical protein
MKTGAFDAWGVSDVVRLHDERTVMRDDREEGKQARE